MIVHHLKSILRQFRRYKFYTGLNVLGLSSGLTICLLIGVYVVHELDYDRFHVDTERIFRLVVKTDFYGEKTIAVISEKAGPVLLEDYPELQNVVRVKHRRQVVLKVDNQLTSIDDAIYADRDFFKLFSFSILSGDPARAIARPGTVVLTRQLAFQLFGDIDPMGRICQIDHKSYEVTGVVDNPPSTSHLQFSLVASMATLEPGLRYNDWTRFAMSTYLKFLPDADIESFKRKILCLSGTAQKPDPGWQEYHLQSIYNIHLEPEIMWDNSTHMDQKMLMIWLLLGAGVLAMAVINYINLSTARIASRVPEVGVRKVLGAKQSNLTQHFLTESLVITLCAFIISLIAAWFMLPVLQQVSGVAVNFSRFFQPLNLFLMAVLWLFTGFAAGCYPAMVLTAFTPISALKYRMDSKRSSALRKILVVVQFALTIILVISTLIIHSQLKYMRERPLGFDKYQKLILPFPYEGGSRFDPLAVKSAFMELAAIKGATLSRGVPGYDMDYASGMRVDQSDGDNRIRIYHMEVDKDFTLIYKLQRVAGTIAGPDVGVAPEQGIFVNEALVKAMGWTTSNDAVGQYLKTGHFSVPVVIAGVFKDFHFAGLQQEIDPVIMAYWPEMTSVLTLQVDIEALQDIRHLLENIWKNHFPAYPYPAFFLDANFNSYYDKEEKVGQALTGVSILGILIAGMGLLGLAAFLTSSRKKEIGIRKVLGASSYQVTWLLSREFFRWVAVANVAAWPLAWWLMRKWLNGFAYRTSVTVTPFIIASCMALSIALLAVSFLTWRSATANPSVSIDSL
ncbi:ABC transporter permease [bacterium]|nr:ABC transporter permease [bacterium]